MLPVIVEEVSLHLRLSAKFLLAAILLFAALLILATIGAQWGWLRSFVGDVLAIIWLYCLIAAFVAMRPWQLTGLVFLIGTALEVLQWLVRAFGLIIPNRALRIIIGATPDWLDILAYALGALLIWLIALRIEQSPGGK